MSIVYTSDAIDNILTDHVVVFNVVTQIFRNIIDYIVVSVIVMSEIQVDGHFVLCISTSKGGCPSGFQVDPGQTPWFRV